MSDRVKNRLASEVSPYLQQHAHNPVDWFPWGAEALAKAKAEDRPILLSIGYSACHWCHVMERESFEDDTIARQMNEGFVNIKVDREERPDLDQIYQRVVQLMGRSGGWPLTVFLTPDQRPFFGGTYFPPRERHGMPGFPAVLSAISQAYRDKREDVEVQAQEITQAVSRAGSLEQKSTEPYNPGPDLLAITASKLARRFDQAHGGFGRRPKFPNSLCLDVLLRRGEQERDQASLDHVVKTLDAMRRGGIWDHLAGGFHRYSTDEKWLVPHFEKMLYDNALLLRLYTEAFRATQSESYAATASDIGTYLLREMQSDEGGFFASQDADTEGEEGRFFVWTEEQMRAQLENDPFAQSIALRHFGITEHGNFENTNASVLAESRTLEDVATDLGEPLTKVREALTRATVAMLSGREKRERPFRDEKILASWNGLVIGALADAGMALGEPSLLSAAEEAFGHLQRTLIADGRVGRLTKGSVVKGTGFLDDHAFLAQAALDLYEATGEARYLATARGIAEQALLRFWDEPTSSFFFSPVGGETLITRTQDPYDQAVPSGGAVLCLTLLKLGAMVDENYALCAERYLNRIAPAAIDNPFGFGQTIAVLDRLVRGSVDVVILGKKSDSAAKALHRAAFAVYLPNRNIVWADPSNPESMAAARALTEGKSAPEGAVAYVCRARTCSPPVTTASELTALLGG